jgi:Protein of unknown function (DUF3341)
MAKNTAVFGLYTKQSDLETAVDLLKASGFRAADVSILYPSNVGNKDMAYEKHSKAPEGATTGAASGLVVGGTLGWLAGIGALAIPGLGPFIAAGPILAALAGMGAGATVGGIGGALIGVGMPEYEAKRYEGRVRAGAYLLSVHCDDSEWASRAEEVLERSGAQDVSSTSESSADYDSSDKPMARR